jgi:hypothetical protein
MTVLTASISGAMGWVIVCCADVVAADKIEPAICHRWRGLYDEYRKTHVLLEKPCLFGHKTAARMLFFCAESNKLRISFPMSISF